MPSVRAQGVEAATETLQDLGFEVVTEEAPGYLGLGFVFSQSPGGGERVPIGSTITLSII
ncbi:PASTA domain-containing protein [Nocardioides caricicola]|uniref:PASTA domain-containing protein n=1 Tax=Nocardioides caricicola TaxID=634770 RepID=UPI003A920813